MVSWRIYLLCLFVFHEGANAHGQSYNQSNTFISIHVASKSRKELDTTAANFLKYRKRRVVNGSNARKGEHPWQVYIQDKHGQFFCGGVIVAAQTVLTAAHCIERDNKRFTKYGPYTVVAGDGGNRNSASNTVQKIQVADGHMFSRYKGASSHWDGDVAILKLETPLTLNDLVQPIKLANPDKLPGRLQKVGITMQDRSTCSRIARKDFKAVFTKHMMCSQDTNQGACRGDSGGPMVCTYRGEPLLVGLVSWSHSDCYYGFNVYARIAQLRTWIMNNV